MIKARLFLLIAGLLAAVSPAALAGPPPAGDAGPPADQPPFGEPETGWSADPGAVVRIRPAHLGSTHYVVDALPMIDIHYGDRLQISLDDGVKYAMFKGPNWSVGPVAEYRQSFTDKLPRGARDVDDAVELGGYGSIRLPFGQLEGRLRRAVSGYDGWSGDLSFDTGVELTPQWALGFEARAAWADSSFTNSYFGLHPAAARRAGLPRFLENDFRTAGVELDAARRIAPNWRIVGALSEDRIIGPIGHTPLLQSRDLLSFTLGVTYHWSAH